MKVEVLSKYPLHLSTRSMRVNRETLLWAAWFVRWRIVSRHGRYIEGASLAGRRGYKRGVIPVVLAGMAGFSRIYLLRLTGVPTELVSGCRRNARMEEYCPRLCSVWWWTLPLGN